MIAIAWVGCIAVILIHFVLYTWLNKKTSCIPRHNRTSSNNQLMQKKQSLLHSFGHAFNGMFHFFLKDRNGEIHLFSALLACASGIYFGLSEGEWLAISFCIGLVIALEMVNAAIEQLCNLVHAEYHPIIKK